MKFKLYFVVGILLVASTFVDTLAPKPNGKPAKAAKQNNAVLNASQAVNRTLVNVGQIAMWIFADGRSANTPGGSSGLIFPRGNSPNTTTIFQDGFIWGGRVLDGSEPQIRVGGQTYIVGTRSGSILSPGVSDFEDRIWRVRKDYFTADLSLDALESGLSVEGVRQQYAQDWLEWPADKGAPFYDADADGSYTPEFNTGGSPKLFPEADEPGVANADQVVWLVANDLDPGRVSTLYGSPPIGLEMQLTLWAYNADNPLSNVIFKRLRLIYKGTATTPASAVIDSMYICQWSDPDVGFAGDDLVGSDTTLGLGYAYNGLPTDAAYSNFGLLPPAAGYDFLQGPIVPSAGNTAIFDFKERPGFRNLPMTTFAFYYPGGPDSDPPRGGDYNGTLQWWNLLRGFRPRPESPPVPWIDPTTSQITKFLVPGDPVTGTGWIDSNPAERLLLLASGPFTMALGDTQEVIVCVLAGLGESHLLSINELKEIDRAA